MKQPPPFIIRLYQPTDFSQVLAVIQAATLADALPRSLSASELRDRLQTPHADPRLDPPEDSWVASVLGAGVVAYADGWLTGHDGQRSYRTDCFVHPAFRGRGIGRALVTRQCQRALAIARRLAEPGSPTVVTLWARAFERQAGVLGLLESKGMQRARTYLEMQRDLAQPPSVSAVPPGLRLEPWLDRRADEAVWQAYHEAFADHWDYQAEAFDGFMRRIIAGRLHTMHSLVAWAGGAVAGASLNDMDAGDSGRPAWIRHLFVRRAWRGRGLGRALLDASLSEARQLGYPTAGLMVDEDNATGALRLYEAAGFAAMARRFTYQRSFTAGADGR